MAREGVLWATQGSDEHWGHRFRQHASHTDGAVRRLAEAPPAVRKNKSRPLSGLLHQAVFVMQALSTDGFAMRKPAGSLRPWPLAGTLSWVGSGSPRPNVE